MNVGSGSVEGNITYGSEGAGLRDPATSESSVRVDGESVGKDTSAPGKAGREGAEGLDGLPKDALAK